MKKIDSELYFMALNISILSRRENLHWLFENVSVERTDAWRDKIFAQIENSIINIVAEREFALKELEEDCSC